MLRFDNNYRIVGTGLYGLESYILMKFLYTLLSNVGGNPCIPIFCFDFGLNYDGEVVIVYLSENGLDSFDYRADAINLPENIFHKNISNKKLLYLLGYNLYKSIKNVFNDKALSDKVDLFRDTSNFTRLMTYFDNKLLLISDLVFLDKAVLDMEIRLADIIFVLYKLMGKTDNRLKLGGDLISQKNLRWCNKDDYNPIMLEINRIKYELMSDCIEKYYMLNDMYLASLSRLPRHTRRRDNNMRDVNVYKIMKRMSRELLYIYKA